MLKKAILLLVVAISTTSCVQSQFFKGIKGNGVVVNETRKVGNYDEVSVSGSFDVSLVYGKEGNLKIKIEENLVEHLVTEVVDGNLKIKWKKGVNIKTRKGVFIIVPFKDLNSVKLYGSGDVVTEDTIKTKDFRTSVSGSGDLVIHVDASTISSSITGSGDVTIIGTTKDLKTSVTGSGDFHGFKLQADNVEAKVTGSGDIAINVGTSLKARVTGSGDIVYRGNPKNQDTKVTGSGDITGK